MLAKNMTRNKLTVGKGVVVTVLCHTINPSKHIKKKCPNIERGQRLKNEVIICREMNKICPK